eukprot:gene11955-12098_t
MADMDEEFARFLGEVKSVEEAVAAAEAEQLQALPSATQAMTAALTVSNAAIPLSTTSCYQHDWPENDFRIFVGDLGNEVNDDSLSKAFSRYPSFAKARVIRDKRSNKSKGYGIVSLLDGNDFAKALKEMNGKYIGNRPCKLSRSTWKERSYEPQHKGKSGGGGGGGGGGEKRRVDGQQGSHNKAQKTGPLGPKFKYHVPIFKQ